MAYDGKIIIDTDIDKSGIQKGMLGIDSMVKGAAVVASVGIIANGIKEIVGSVLDAGMAFETRMSGIQAVSGATAAEMAKLQAAAMQAGQDTVYSASESAQAIEELIKAGLSTQQVLGGGLTGALNLASAGELGLADAAEIASTALNAFKADNMSMAQAANILAGAANASATDVMGLKMGLSQASAVASGVGMTFQDTSTALALFAQNGLKGSDAGTSLKTMLLNLQPNTQKSADEFQRLGLMAADGTSVFYDASGSLKSLSEISGILTDKMKGMTDAQRLSTMTTLFGTDAVRAANILYKEGAQGVNDMWAAMSNVTAADVAAERLNNLAGAVEFMKGSLETVGIKVYNAFKEPLKDSVNYINDAVESMSKAFDSPELQKSFATIGDAIKAISKGFSNFVAGAIPGLVNGFAVVISTIEFLSPLILAAIAGFVAYKVVTMSITLATTLAAAAQWLWNAAMAANPVGLVVAAVAALAVGIWALAGKLNEASKETRDYIDANKKLLQSIDDLTTASKDSADAYAEKVKGMNAEKEATDALIAKVYELNGVQGRTDEQNKELAANVEVLNKRVEGAGLVYDDLTGTLNLTEQQLRDVADAQDASNRKASGTERLSELYSEQAKAAAVLDDAEQARADTASRLRTATGNDYCELSGLLSQQTEKVNEAKRTEASYATLIKGATGEVNRARQTEASVASRTAKTVSAASEAETKATEELQKAMAKSYEKIVDQSRTMFSRMDQNSVINVRKMAKNLLQNAKDVQEWSQNLDELARRGVDEGIIAELRDAGPKAAKQTRVMVNASDTELGKLNKAWRKNSHYAAKAVEDEFSNPDFTNSGADAVEAIDKKTTKAANDANFEETGADMAGDLQDGVEGKSDEISAAAESTVQKAKGAALQEVRNKDFDGVGRQMMYGIAHGIRTGAPVVYSAIQHMVDAAIAAARKSLQIASPSKRFEREVGAPSVEGYVKPFKDSRATEVTMSGFVSRMVAAAQFQAAESSRGAQFSGAALALTGGFTMGGGNGPDLDRLADKIAGAVSGMVVKMDGETLGRIVEPVISRRQGTRIESMKRSGYRGK